MRTEILSDVDRRCYACGETKPAEDFPRDRGKASGRASICKACDREKAKNYYNNHRDAVIARIRATKS